MTEKEVLQTLFIFGAEEGFEALTSVLVRSLLAICATVTSEDDLFWDTEFASLTIHVHGEEEGCPPSQQLH